MDGGPYVLREDLGQVAELDPNQGALGVNRDGCTSAQDAANRPPLRVRKPGSSRVREQRGIFLRRKLARSWFDKLTTSGQLPLILSLSKDEPCRTRASPGLSLAFWVF
jgi:hypothetical protein